MKKYATSTGYLIYRASVPPHQHKTIHTRPRVVGRWSRRVLRVLRLQMAPLPAVWAPDVTCEVPEEDALADAVFAGAAAGRVVSTEAWEPDSPCRFTCGYKDARFYQIDIKSVKNMYSLPLIQQLFFKGPQHKRLRPGLNLSGMDASVCPLVMLQVDDSRTVGSYSHDLKMTSADIPRLASQNPTNALQV